MKIRLFLVGGLIAATLAMSPPSAGAAEKPASLASFEGQAVDLTRGWGQARACAGLGEATTCFRSEAEMDDWLATEGEGAARLLGCGSSVRLYSNGSYGGSVLYLSDQWFWINLGDYGFNDVMSSFKIGACDSWMAEHDWGGGAWYPGSTSAWTETPVVASGWNDRVSSIYIG